jgi:hypothetical protein
VALKHLCDERRAGRAKPFRTKERRSREPQAEHYSGFPPTFVPDCRRGSLFDMTLQCSVCQTRSECETSFEDWTALKDLGAALFPCEACGRKTYHIYPSSDYRPGMDRRIFHTMAVSSSAPAPAAAPPDAPAPVAAPRVAAQSASTDRDDSRGQRRVPLALPLRVRSDEFGGFTEVIKTVNVSRGGVYFHSERPYRTHQELKVALNYSAAASEHMEQRAQVVRVQTLDGDSKKGVAVKYL